MTTLNGEIYYTCPYDKSHRIISWRMSKHIQKCKKNHPDVKVSICRFNSTHIIANTEISAHEDTCKDRIKLDTFVFRPEDTLENQYPIQNQDVLNDSDELWDNENVVTYNPEDYCLNNKILRRLDVASAATRKNFRLEERRRFQQLENEPAPAPNAQNVPLRKPKTRPECLPPLAETIDPNSIISKFETLNIKVEEEKKKEDEFVVVKHRGRGRRCPAKN